jgi:predicted ATP-grasp superfamily ATP-dependent carboligase
MKILVLDANQRSALAATRSLGAAGHHVVTADEGPTTLAGASRWSRSALVYPSAAESPDEFLDWADENIAGEQFDAALPMSEITTDLLVRHRERWPALLLPFADIQVIDALSDKVALYERAVELGVPVPRSIVVRTASHLEQAVREIGFPAILKPARSRIRHGQGFMSTAVRRVNAPDELSAAIGTPAFERPFLYQSIVNGAGQGIFALYRDGSPVAFFAHRRLREKPPAGGVSVYSESCHPDTTLLEMTQRLLGDAGWHGVAMVEFKGRYLMEVNARFWGSLQLAIDAGVDFPRLLVDQASAGDIGVRLQHNDLPYRVGRRLRWWLGDLDRLYLVTRAFRDYGAKGLMREWARFLRPDPGRTRHETFRWRDPAPAAREMQHYLRSISGAPPPRSRPRPLDQCAVSASRAAAARK